MDLCIKKETNWLILFILGIYELFVTFFMLLSGYIMIAEITEENGYSLDFLPLFILLILLWTIVLDLILWNMNGREIIEIVDDSIIIRKKGRLFNKTFSIEFFEIENVYLQKKGGSILDKLKKVVGRNGRICISYLGRSVSVGSDLTEQEAVEYINKLKAFLKNT